ncbi:MAG: amidase, partial [Chloroflexota bacterium]
MNLTEYTQYDGLGLADLIKQGDVTAKELGQLFLAAVEAINPQINAVIETYADRIEAMSQDYKPDGPFAGVPFLLKDLIIAEAGKESASGSRLGQGWIATEDALLTQRFKQAGLTLLGRTTTPEFGLSGSTESLLTGKTRNPWNLDKMAGGSSGGAAAAVSSGLLPMANASDGAGSIRIPASCCNLVGLKVSRGRVSHYPRPEHAYDFGVEFIVSHTVRDSAAMLDAVGGPAPGDFAVIHQPHQPYLTDSETPPQPLRIAFTTAQWGPVPTDPEVVAVVEQIAQQCEAMGHTVTNASPHYDYEPFLKAMLVMWGLGADHGLQALAQATGREINEQTLETVTLSFYNFAKALTTTDFVEAMDVLNQVNRSVGHFFETYDLLLTPTLGLLPQ